MSIYAIGDVQGCYRSLQRLLAYCQFQPGKDTLWLVGDLVNRGPQSLETLRFVRSLGSAARIVLGNHDLYLLMVAYGALPKRSKDDTLDPVLQAPDAAEILDWLRQQPLCLTQQGFCMVHAGLLPAWSAEQACALSAEVEHALQNEGFESFLSQLWGSQPDHWSDDLQGIERLRVIVNVMTRMRFCSLDGRLDFKAKGPLAKAPAGLLPWYALPGQADRSETLVVGHWSALGLLQCDKLLAIDTGCLWGGPLTAIRLEDRALFQVESDPDDRQPADFAE